jgi:hypothetical protein
MQPLLPSCQNHFLLLPFWVGDAAVNRTNSSTLWLLMEAYAFSTFVWYDVVKVIADRRLLNVCVDDIASLNFIRFGDGGAFAHFPLYTTFIDGSVGAFWFAGSAVDTVVGDKNSPGGSLLVQRSVGIFSASGLDFRG